MDAKIMIIGAECVKLKYHHSSYHLFMQLQSVSRLKFASVILGLGWLHVPSSFPGLAAPLEAGHWRSQGGGDSPRVVGSRQPHLVGARCHVSSACAIRRQNNIRLTLACWCSRRRCHAQLCEESEQRGDGGVGELRRCRSQNWPPWTF
jgi:hypothetical protein